jgi:LPXTG-motif cell wall-anchored protein
MDALLVAAGVLIAAGAGFALYRKKKKRSPEPPAGPVAYRSFQGDAYTRHEVRGPTISLLVPEVTPECAFILDYAEAAHRHYRELTGHAHDRVRIAVVNATCGIEIMAANWAQMLEGARSGKADWIPMYELGRNYWLYKPLGEFTTGFAVFNGLTIARQFTMRPFREHITWAQFDARIGALIDRYVDHGHRYADTFAAGKGIPEDPEFAHGADLWASLLLRLHRDYDMRGFFRRLDRNARDPAAAFLAAAPAPARKWLVDVIG